MKPLDWFRQQGYGSQKKAAAEMGWHYVFINQVIHEKEFCSRHFANCMEKYTNGAVRFDECNIRKKGFQ